MTSATLRSLFAAFERANAHWRRSMSLGVNEFLVLFHLWMEDAGSLAMGEIGHLINVTSGGLTALVDRLERGGYVRRSSDPGDRRRTLLQLTERGSAARTTFMDLLDEVHRASSELPSDQQAAIEAFIERLTVAFRSVQVAGATDEP